MAEQENEKLRNRKEKNLKRKGINEKISSKCSIYTLVLLLFCIQSGGERHREPDPVGPD